MRILIVEDEPVHRRLLASVLSRWGYDIDTVEDATQAWERLREGPAPSLVLTDWEMPGLDGLGLAELIREDARLDRIPIVVVTVCASTVTSDPRVSYVNGVLVKPWDPKELRDTVEKLVGASSAAESDCELLER